MKLRTFLTTAVAAAAALAFTAPAPLAQTAYKSEYRMSLVLGPAFPWGKGGELWANKVRERTQGRINIKLYPGVSLIQGDQTREFSALRQGGGRGERQGRGGGHGGGEEGTQFHGFSLL